MWFRFTVSMPLQPSRSPGAAGEWCRRVSQRVYRASRRVICISERVREEVLQGTGQSCRTSVVYNGSGSEIVFSGTRDVHPLRLIVLSVGNLIPIKGHDVLLRAIAAIAGEFPELVLEIIGDGPERHRLESLASQLGIGDRVRFLGRQSRQQVAEAMRRCTRICAPQPLRRPGLCLPRGDGDGQGGDRLPRAGNCRNHPPRFQRLSGRPRQRQRIGIGTGHAAA